MIDKFASMDDPFLQGFYDELQAAGLDKEAGELLKRFRDVIGGFIKKAPKKAPPVKRAPVAARPAPAPAPKKPSEEIFWGHDDARIHRRMDKGRSAG